MAGRPFAIVGVNSDNAQTPQSRAKLNRLLEEAGISWRNFADSAGSQTISRTWNVSRWPTFYVIDHRGTIRDKGRWSRRMQALVEELVGEAEEP